MRKKSHEVDAWHLLGSMDGEWRTAARIKTTFKIPGSTEDVAKALEGLANTGSIDRSYKLTDGLRRNQGWPGLHFRPIFIIKYRKRS